jgi:dTDP-4-amino-4,6-dideoxygalactose transaminase
LVKPRLPRLEEIEVDLREMLDSGRLSNFGPFSRELEKRIGAMTGVKHVISMSSGTTALTLLLNMLPKGSEVIVPSFTFLASVQAVLWNSLIPVFVDVDIESQTMCPSDVASKITLNTSAILAVNTFGSPCLIEELEALADERGIELFFDSAHAIGARHDGRYLGCYGKAEVFSLSATKLLPCGEGGVITTNSDAVYAAMLNRRNYGFTADSRDCENLGMNGKLTEFCAILGLKEIESIDDEVVKRNRIARQYREALGCLPGIGFQSVRMNDISAYKDFTITVDSRSFGISRNNLKGALADRGIETEAYFSPPLHQMKYFRESVASKLPNTEALGRQVLSLPIYSDMTADELEYVIDSIVCCCRSDVLV